MFANIGGLFLDIFPTGNVRHNKLMLVGIVRLMSILVVRFAPEPAPAAPVVPTRATRVPVAAAPAITPATLAVIREAVRQHRDAGR